MGKYIFVFLKPYLQWKYVMQCEMYSIEWQLKSVEFEAIDDVRATRIARGVIAHNTAHMPRHGWKKLNREWVFENYFLHFFAAPEYLARHIQTFPDVDHPRSLKRILCAMNKPQHRQ